MQPYSQPPTTLQDPLRVQRRQLDPQDILEIVRRNKSWLLAPALAGLVVAVVVAFLWPDTYVSTAVIRVVPPQVPEAFVPASLTSQMSQRINSMGQQILSRSTLSSIVETYGLYPRKRERLPLEDIIEDMRRDIEIGSVRNIQPARGNTLTAFQVEFAYENRYLAQKVTSDIVTRFINENTRERTTQTAMTTQFLRDQWQAAKNDLDALERKLTDFRIRNAGQLPDQWPVNVQQMSALETRITSLNGAIGRLNQEKLVLEAEIRVTRDRIASILKGSEASPVEIGDPRLARLNEQIRAAERNLAALLDTYKPNHPDVQRYQAQIEVLRRERDDHLETLKRKAGEQKGPVLGPEQAAEVRDLNARIQRLVTQVRAKDLEIQDDEKEIAQANQRIQALQRRMEAAPVGEQEYTALLREYDLAKRRYDDMNLKKSTSEIVTDLEKRNQGETLELLDPPSLPEQPTRPIRSAIIVLGAFAGAGLGGVLVFLREMKDSSLKTLKDVRAYTQLTILGCIPLLENDLVVMRRRRMAWLAWATAGLFSALAMAGSIYYYYATKV